MSLINNFKYRPEIDGLRAIAVLAVVLFHADLGVSGGFVGVDVFFVISGFLITSLILKDIQSERFSMADFWERRARRILPASICMTLTVAALGWFFLLPSEYIGLARSMVSQAVFSSNFYFWRTTGYFAGPAEELPLLHTWSLSVEEQYYFFIPCALWLLYQLVRTHKRAALLCVISVGAVLSLLLSVVLLHQRPAATFFLLPTRAWELLCGSFVALLPLSCVPKEKKTRELLSIIGLLGILVPCFSYSEVTPFPGLSAVPVCFGTACLIFFNTPVASMSQTIVSKLLSFRVVVFVGLISYSLYLWHWPIFAYTNYWRLGALSFGLKLVLVFCSLLCAVVSWRYVETPFRVKKISNSRSSMLWYSVGGTFVMCAIAVAVIFSGGAPFRYSKRVNDIDAVRVQNAWDHLIVQPLSLENAERGEFPFLEDSRAPARLLIWGDSHARSVLPAFSSISANEGFGVAVAWNSSTPPVLNFIPTGQASQKELSPKIAKSVIDYVRRENVPTVLLVAQWSGYYDWASRRGAERELTNQFVETITALRSVGAEVWIMEEVPRHYVDVPNAIIRRELYGTNIDRYQANLTSHRKHNEGFSFAKGQLESSGAKIIEVSSFFYQESSRNFKMEDHGQMLYFDDNHLTPAGASLLTGGFIELFQSLSSKTRD